MSIKSISVDETPDLEYKNLLDGIKRIEHRMDSLLVEETPEEYLGETHTELEKLRVLENSSTSG